MEQLFWEISKGGTLFSQRLMAMRWQPAALQHIAGRAYCFQYRQGRLSHLMTH
jgi:hypothetical protein